MNASFGRNSGRGNRRENYYKFKRPDSNDSSKLQELVFCNVSTHPKVVAANRVVYRALWMFVVHLVGALATSDMKYKVPPRCFVGLTFGESRSDIALVG